MKTLIRELGLAAGLTACAFVGLAVKRMFPQFPIGNPDPNIICIAKGCHEVQTVFGDFCVNCEFDQSRQKMQTELDRVLMDAALDEFGKWK